MEQQIDKQDECYIIEYHLEILKIVIYSFIGIFVFFIPIKLNGEWLTLIYHIGYKLQQDITPFLKMITVLYVTLGCIKPIVKNKNVDMYFYINLFSILIILNIFYLKDSIIILDNNALLVMEDLILNIITIFPISAIFMTFLLNYGLLDIVESYTQKIMKKTFNISGKSLVNILVYFFTDCFCGMFMTNKLYESGKLREKEACIIILSFSILSFNVIKYICEELNL
ncbi:MAG: nucleoside recognition domain-containing protein, partial [Peptostreptococcaceae bacterium]